MKSPDKLWWLLFPYALGYAAILLSLHGLRIYEPSPFHRCQAEALLQGHLSLTDSVGALQSGLVWYGGGVQHVWGLGVGIWLLPFTALWRIFSSSPCPDGLALGMAFVLLASFSGNTGVKMVRQGRRAEGLGIILLMVMCPAVWTLARVDELVFEETELYAVILSLGILVSLVRVLLFKTRADYYFCCLLGAFAIWVRPTLAAYGVAAMFIASWTLWRYRPGRKAIVIGVLMCAVSLSTLAWTNWIRFGDPLEFGHRLTFSSANMMYLTRFGNPWRDASAAQAAKELFGLLFLAHAQGANAFSDDLFAGQSNLTRWRRIDLDTFDLGYAVVLLLAVVVAAFWLLRQRRLTVTDRRQDVGLIAALLAWSFLSASALGGFYLYYPAMASRYLLDFAPAFSGFALVLLMLWPAKLAKFSFPLLALWLGYEIVSARTPVEELHIQPPLRLGWAGDHETPLKEFHGLYTTENHPSRMGITANGHGWEPGTGFAEAVVSLLIDHPQFLELRVSDRRRFNGRLANKDVYRAQMDGIELPLKSVSKEQDGLKVTFDLPDRTAWKDEIHAVFLCFSDGFDKEDRNSERFLFSVRWQPQGISFRRSTSQRTPYTPPRPLETPIPPP